MFSKEFTKQLVTVTLLVSLCTQGLISCGSDDEPVGPDSATATGVFLDSEVEGLTFQSGDNAPGTTDDNGTFTYTPGEPLTFSVGGVELGTLDDGAAICTPNDFIIPENIARFLQSIDSDGDPSNGIDLSAAAAALANQNVSSDVFENASSTGFAADTAIINALATTGDVLIDPTTALNNLANGTDSTFDPAELAGKSFALGSQLDAGLGIITFAALVNGGDQGSTGSDIPFDDVISNGGSGIDEDFTWVINASGVLVLTFEDGEEVTVKKAGSSDRAITGVVTESGSTPYVVTLLKPLSMTETQLCGEPVSQNGTATRTFNLTTGDGTESVTFKSDGTLVGDDPVEGQFSGFWTIGEVAPNVLKVIDGPSDDIEWTILMLLDGSLDTNAQLFAADVTFNGSNGTNGFNFTWSELGFITFVPAGS